MKKAQIGTIVKVSETHTRLTLVAKFPNGDTLRYYTSYSGEGLSSKVLPTNPIISQADLKSIFAQIKKIGTDNTQNGIKFQMIKDMVEKFTSIQSFAAQK